MHEQAGVTLSFNGWKNIVNQELLGSKIVLPSGETTYWRNVMCDFEKQKIAAIVSDSATAYASER